MIHRLSASCALLGLVLAGCSGTADLEEKIAAAEKLYSELSDEETKLRKKVSSLNAERNDYLGLLNRSSLVQQELRDKELRFAPMFDYIRTVEDAIKKHSEDVALWRSAHRKSLEGLKLESLQKNDGQKLENIEIVSVGDEEVVISQNGSNLTLAIRDLAPEFRQRFVYESEIKGDF